MLVSDMAVQDFITPDEFADAPEDPAMAFADLVGRAERRLSELLNPLFDQQNSYYQFETLQHGFMNVVVGLARSFKVEPFASRDVPRRKDYDDGEFIEFKADLDHYLTQLLVDNTIRNRQNSVLLVEKDKERIRVHVRAIKDAIDKASLSEAKRSALHKKLTDFEKALEKTRLNLMEATMFAIAILGLPGAVWTSAEVVGKLTQTVLTIVAEAKVVDDENRRLAPTEAPAALMPPRKDDLRGPFGKSKSGASLAEELDDEVPF
jgi:hypothetical protein